MPEVIPANVDEVFKLPLRNPKAVVLSGVQDISVQSVDFDYQPKGRCTQQNNGSISCWTQVIEAEFTIFERVSLDLLSDRCV